MHYKIVILYGLPGSGKTTLCNKLVQVYDNIKYINLEKTINEKKDIIKKILNEIDYDTNIITEGAFPDLRYRNYIKKSLNNINIYPIFIFLNETFETLSKRRPKSIDSYKKIYETFDIINSEKIKIYDLNKRVEEISKYFYNIKKKGKI